MSDRDAAFERIMAVFERGEGAVSRSDFVAMLKETSLADRADALGDLFYEAVSKYSLDKAFDLVEAVFPGVVIQGTFVANREMSSKSASILWTNGVTAADGLSKYLCPAHQTVQAFLNLFKQLRMKSPDVLKGKIEPMTGRFVTAGVIRNEV